MKMLKIFALAWVLAFVCMFLDVEQSFAQQGMHCVPIDAQSAAIEEANSSVVANFTVIVRYTIRDCEMLMDYNPHEIGVLRLQILRQMRYETLKRVSGQPDVILAKGNISAPIGRNTGRIFDKFEYGPTFEDTPTDPSYWENRDGKVMPTDEFKETMIVLAAFQGLLVEKAQQTNIEMHYLFASQEGSWAGTTAEDKEVVDCSQNIPMIVVDPNVYINEILMLGYERMVHILRFQAHEVFHAFSFYRDQHIGHDDLEYGDVEESFAEVYGRWATTLLLEDPNFQMLWGFEYFQGIPIEDLKDSLRDINDFLYNLYQSWWATGEFRDYVFAPVVAEYFPGDKINDLIRSMFIFCNEVHSVQKAAADIGILVNWKGMVIQQVAACLGSQGNSLYSDSCRTELFTAGQVRLQSGYVCMDSSSDKDIVRVPIVLPATGLIYLYEITSGTWGYDDWFRANPKEAFRPYQHPEPFEPSSTNRFCIFTGFEPLYFDLQGSTPEAFYLPLIGGSPSVSSASQGR